MYNTDKEVFFNDAAKLSTDELPDFDLFVGGFPCQPFSVAGKRRGFEDTRGTLFYHIAKIIKAKRPAAFLLENVPGLLSHGEGETYKTILETFSELGYCLDMVKRIRCACLTVRISEYRSSGAGCSLSDILIPVCTK